MADPRTVRTRQLLHDALYRLMETNDFDKISVQDIADAATVNRATFYDHYTDKAALLECMVAGRFQQLLAQRGVAFDACSEALTGMALGVCDYLAALPGNPPRLDPHMESAIISVLRRMLLEGLKKHRQSEKIAPELVASTIAWGLYGAAREWLCTPQRCPPEAIVPSIAALIAPILG
jgi:AcrR family transcriptional regulator